MRLLLPLLPLLCLALLLAPGAVPQETVPSGAIHVATVDQAITGATERYLRSALEAAERHEAEVLIVKLDTPGGLLEATRQIVQMILNSEVPVVIYIAPQGARGASAGTMITLASHVAAMAPATHIGAAHPVQLFGGGGDNEVMTEKVVNDTSAFVKSIAELRGRNAEWAISAVRESKSITAQEALDNNVVEIIAEDVTDLVSQLHGRQVRMDRETMLTLETTGKPVIDQDMSFTQDFFSTISNPNLVFLLLIVGLVGLYIEFSNPGLIVPGVAGAIALLLALMAMQTLPISYGMLGLMLLGVGLLVAESFVPSFGVLGIAGIASMLVGSLFLLDQQQTDLQTSRPMVFAAVASVAVIALLIGRLLVKSFRMPARSATDTLVGSEARARDAIPAGSTGTVFIYGEHWRAEAEANVEAGATVVVTGKQGLTLRVRPVDEPGPAGGEQAPTEEREHT